MPTQRKSKSLALKTINERVEAHDSSDEDVVKKDVAYLVKNFRKFLKFKNNGKFGDKGKFQSFGKEKKEFKRKDGATTLSDLNSSNSDSEESCDGEGNYSAFMIIAHVESSEDLNLLVQELGEHSDEESMGIVEESDGEEDESIEGLQENFNSFLEKSGEYAHMAKAAVKKMKKADEDYRSLLVRYKEAKCEIETLNGELIEAYSKTKFLEHEVVQANAKVDRVSSNKLNEMLAHKKPFSDKSGLGYAGESSLAVKITKEMKFVQAKELVVADSTPKKVEDGKKKNVTDQ